MTRRGYDGVAVAVPVTVPYERFSTRGAPWFLGERMSALDIFLCVMTRWTPKRD